LGVEEGCKVTLSALAQGICVTLASILGLLFSLVAVDPIQAHELQTAARAEMTARLLDTLADPLSSPDLLIVAGSGELRKALIRMPEVAELAASPSPQAIAAIEAELARDQPPANADVTYAALCYVLESGRSASSIPPLVEFYRRAKDRFPFSPDFAIHALKVISHQPDVDTRYYVYSPEKAMETVTRALAWFEENKERERRQ
jgi:hypothetical protein